MAMKMDFVSKQKERQNQTLVNSKIQTELEVNPPNDKYEQEADKVADKVSRMPANASDNLQMLPKEDEEKKLQMKTAEEDESLSMKPEEEKEKIQMSAGNSANEQEPQVSSALTSQLQSTKGQGNTLPENISREMSQKIGSDFSNVRVHTGANAVQMNRELNAQAFTHGNNIYFNNGKYSPESSSGKHLLAHELTHTVQQSDGISKVQSERIQRIPQNPGGTPFTGKVTSAIGAELKETASPAGKVLVTVPDNSEVTVTGGDEWLNVTTKVAKVQYTGFMNCSLIRRETSFTNTTDVGFSATSSLALYNDTVVIRKKINFVNGGGFTGDRFDKLKQRFINVINSYLNRKFSLKVATPPPGKAQPGDKKYPILVELNDSAPNTYDLTLLGGVHGRGNTGTIYELGQASETEVADAYLAHEAAHIFLGSSNEYADPAYPKRKVYTDNSVMGNFYIEGKNKAEMKARHFQFIVPIMQPWFPGRTLTIE